MSETEDRPATATGAVLPQDDILMNEGGGGPGVPAEDAVLLQLDDLLPDASGEIVLFADDDLPLNIQASEPLTGAGIAEAHVTDGGLDVTGLHYYSFESGITLYSPTDLLIVDDPNAA